MIYPDLQGKVALITGGSGGIGSETARVLAAQGVRVAVKGRDEAAIDAAVIALSKQLAYELGPVGIRVNDIAPSTIMTDRPAARMPQEFKDRMLAEHPLGRLGTPLDVANVTAFLASDASSWLTGLTIDVAGGRWMP